MSPGGTSAELARLQEAAQGLNCIEAKDLRGLSASENLQLRPLSLGGPKSYMLAALQERPHFARCFLARAEDGIVGWSLVRWFKRFEDHPRNAHLSVFVAVEWRRRGLGRCLLAHATAFCREHGLTPWVFGETASQMNFYKACHAEEHVSSRPFETN
jgi:GNAT superfamily N-acetyltransferase